MEAMEVIPLHAPGVVDGEGADGGLWVCRGARRGEVLLEAPAAAARQHAANRAVVPCCCSCGRFVGGADAHR
eukprot:gene56082-20072_t